MGQNRDMSRRLFLGAMLLAGYQLADPKVQAVASEDLGSWQQGEGGNSAAKRQWVDSVNRLVELPLEIKTVVPTGVYGQAVLAAMDPSLIASLAKPLIGLQGLFLEEQLADLPVTGRLYSASASAFDVDRVKAIAPDLVLDFGEYKETTLEDMNELQDILGIPVVHINSDQLHLFKAIETLGNLLGTKKATELSEFAHDALLYARSCAAEVDDSSKYRICIANGERGALSHGTNTLENEVIENAGALNCVEGVTYRRSATLTTELLESWNPDVVFMASRQCYEDYSSSPYATSITWEALSAHFGDRIIPGKYSASLWFEDMTILDKQIIGSLYLGKILHPDIYNIDLEDVLAKYVELYFGADMPTAYSAEADDLPLIASRDEIKDQNKELEERNNQIMEEFKRFQEERREARLRGEE